MTKHGRTTTTKTTEKAYFHTGNSGMTFSIKEIEDANQSGEKSHSYRLEVRHGAFGSYSTIDIPLGSDHVCEWMVQALLRTRNRMTQNNFQSEYAFQYSREKNADDYVKMIDGLSRESVTKEYVLDAHSTETRRVAYNFYDDDVLVKTEPCDPIAVGGSGEDSCGRGGLGAGRYKPEDFGKEIVDGKIIR